MITFVMEYENYSFMEALQMLADRAGVALPKQGDSKEAKEAADLRTALLEINRMAADHYYYQLTNPQGEAGYRYFEGQAAVRRYHPPFRTWFCQ